MSRLIHLYPNIEKLPTPLRELALKNERRAGRLEGMLERGEVALQDVTIYFLDDLGLEIGNIETVLAKDETADGKKQKRDRERHARFVSCVWSLEERTPGSFFKPVMFFNENVAAMAIADELIAIEAKLIKSGDFIDRRLPARNTLERKIREQRKDPDADLITLKPPSKPCG